MKKIVWIILAVVLLAAAGVGGVFLFRHIEMKNAPDPHPVAEDYLNELLTQSQKEKFGIFVGFELNGEYELSYRRAVMTGKATYLDGAKLSAGIGADMNDCLARFVDGARLAADVYNEDDSFKEEVLKAAFDEVASARLADSEYRSVGEMTLELEYDGESWSVAAFTAPFEGQSAADAESALYAAATASLTYVKKQYRIGEDATAGPKPEQSRFGSTDDPAVIEELLATKEAQALINGQETAFSAELDFIPDRLIRYYLDESILVIEWQEETALAVGTYSEIFVADGSQIRRKIVGDEPFAGFEYPTELAKQANAVLAVGGDLYNHGRACGIVVYDRKICRFEPNSCDTCFITADGNMLYAKAGQFTQQAEAERFIEENDVLFSLCFGPVLIEDGLDVTPWSYAWGEINDTYARSALGMLGEKHYLTMNINCEWGGYYFLATLRQATEAMLDHGCVTAYALDGGQTAATVMNGELINLVQFGVEKLTSDIIYFATAVPEA